MKKLALVGAGSETRDAAPWQDLSVDIWLMNEYATSPWVKRYSAVLQMHKPEIYTAANIKDPRHWEWLQQARGIPIYMEDVDPRVPDSVRYPLEEALALTGHRYFSSTICYALALAKLQGYEQIDLYGIEMAASEYLYQAECYRFWVGYLIGAGVKVNLHSGQKLFQDLLYGYEGTQVFEADYFKCRAAELAKQWDMAESNVKAWMKTVKRTIEQDKADQLPGDVKELNEKGRAGGELAGALGVAEKNAGLSPDFVDRRAFEFAAAIAQRDGEEQKMLWLQNVGKVDLMWTIWKQQRTPQNAMNLLTLIHAAYENSYQFGLQLGIYRENVEYMKKYDLQARAAGLTAGQP